MMARIEKVVLKIERCMISLQGGPINLNVE